MHFHLRIRIKNQQEIAAAVVRTLENGERSKKNPLNFNGTDNKRVVSGYCCAENGVAQKVF